MTGPGPAPDAMAEWRDSARTHDHDRYISALLAPADRRDALLVLQAFDAEMARIPHAVSEPLLAEIRLQWWRDALMPLLTGPARASRDVTATGHPLADAVLDLAIAQRLPPATIHGLIDARSAEVSDAPLADEGALTTYLDKTDTALVRLAAGVLVPAADNSDADRWAQPVGRALGLTRLARRLLRRDPLADVLVPLSVWPLDARHRHAGEPATEARTQAAREQAVRHVLAMAQAHLVLARTALNDLPRALCSAVLPVVVVTRDVARLGAFLDKDATGRAARPVDDNPLARIWTLWRARHKSRLL